MDNYAAFRQSYNVPFYSRYRCTKLKFIFPLAIDPSNHDAHYFSVKTKVKTRKNIIITEVNYSNYKVLCEHQT